VVEGVKGGQPRNWLLRRREKYIAAFARRPWLTSLRGALFVGAMCAIALLLGGSSFGSAWRAAAVVGCVWIPLHRFVLGPLDLKRKKPFF
jgi:hypothetical protein